MLGYTGERAVPWNPQTGGRIMHHHAIRYAWAIQYVAKRAVVDLGCGTGYGSFMLSWSARSVLGVDNDKESITAARERFTADNLRYRVGNLTKRLPGAEVYVAFEFLEHIEDPVAPLAKIDALLVWSIPVNVGGPFHKRTYTVQEAIDLVGGEIYIQTENGLIYPGLPRNLRPTYILGVRR